MGKLQRLEVVDVNGPSLRERLKSAIEAFRSQWSGPITSNSPELARLFGATPISSGINVSEASALNYSAVWAAVNLISSQIGNLPCVLYRKDGNSKTKFDSHPLYRIVHDRPNPEVSAFTFRQTLQAHVLNWGNGYAEIERNGSNAVAGLWPITPDRVTPFRRSADSPLQYRVTNPGGGEVFIQAVDMLHVKGLGYDGCVGYSVIAKARESLGLGIAAERFGSTFFGNGATFGGVISYKGPRPTELADKNYREQLEFKHQGVDRAHKLLALYNDATYTRMGIPPNDAQFLETRTFQIDEVARWYNVPPHKLKELARSTNNNIEHQNLEWLIDCLGTWLECWEQELNYKLVAPSERNLQEIEFNAEGLLRGDSASRGSFYREQHNTASITPNEIRGLENRNAIPGGDEAFVNGAMVPLSLVNDWWQAQIDEKKAQIQKLKEPPPVPTGPTQQEMDRAITERDAARRKAQEEEDLRDMALAEAKASTDKIGQLEERISYLEGALGKEVELRESLEQDVTAVTKEWDETRGELDTANAVAAELRVQVATVIKERDDERAAHSEARTARVLAESALAQSEEARLQVAHAYKQEMAATDQLRGNLGAARSATLAAIVDRLSYMIDYESDRARQMQGSPDKLRRWVERFYQDYADKCRDILRPSVKAWMVCTAHPEPLEHVLDVLASQHVESSSRQLRTVADEHDGETMPAALERLLRRWAVDRAEQTANRVLKEGV